MVPLGLHDNHIHLLGTVALTCARSGRPERQPDRLVAKVGECLPRYARQGTGWWSTSGPHDGNVPHRCPCHPAGGSDAAALNNPVMLAGVDGHAGGYNSRLPAQAADEDGNVVGFNATTLAPGGVFEAFIPMWISQVAWSGTPLQRQVP